MQESVKNVIIVAERVIAMLERKIEKDLIEWKNNTNKKCLLIRGARQVGKTYIIDKFAKENYENYIYINFELFPSLKRIFDGDLDINTLRMNIEVNFPDKKLVPNKTIIFLDEIQSCPNARVALKTFALDKSYDVIASGSLLGLYYKEIKSYPVGYETDIEMYPLDFEEFLWALGVSKYIIKSLKESFNNKKNISDVVLSKIEEYFKLYILIGGMPDVVNEYLNSKSLTNVLNVQRSIVKNYKNDVVKYASDDDKNKILDTFDSIPRQLARKNKKFQYNLINTNDGNVGERKYKSSIEWLKDAGIVNLCYNLTEPAAPLVSNMINDSYKMYMKDTGLLISMLEDGTQKLILENNLDINEGSILENVFAEEIMSKYNYVTYFEKKSKLEIDFILNIDGVITAIEVKSGNNKQAKSLKSIINNYKTVKRYMKFELTDKIYVDENGIEHYPLFMIMFIK